MFYLGISAYYHDASVALLDSDGNLIDFKKEEWLSRVKGDKSFPRQGLLELIKNHNLSEKNLTSITFYEKPVRAWITVLKHSVKYNPIKNDLTRNYFKNAWRSSMRFHLDLSKYLNVKKIPILYAEHHLSHTLSTLYYYNEFPCVSVVVDGYGDKYCTSIHHVKSHNEIINVWSSEYPNSLGLFYSAITDFLGFAVNEGEYKMMGLASFGEPKYYDVFSKSIKFENNKLEIDTKYYDYVRRTDRSYSDLLTKELGVKPRRPDIPFEVGTDDFKIYANVAASAQKLLEGNKELKSSTVWGGKKESVLIGLENDLLVTLPRGDFRNLTINYTIQNNIQAPIKAGDELGLVEVISNNNIVVSESLIALEDIDEKGFFGRMIAKIILWFIGLFNFNE